MVTTEKVNVKGYKSFTEKSDEQIESLMKKDGTVFVQEDNVCVAESELYLFEVDYKDEIQIAVNYLKSLFSFLENENFNCYINDLDDGYIVMFLFKDFSVAGFKTLLSGMVSETIEEVEIKERMRDSLKKVSE